MKEIGLGGFFGRNGGVAGCARQMTAILKAKKSHGISLPPQRGRRRVLAPDQAHFPSHLAVVLLLLSSEPIKIRRLMLALAAAAAH